MYRYYRIIHLILVLAFLVSGCGRSNTKVDSVIEVPSKTPVMAIKDAKSILLTAKTWINDDYYGFAGEMTNQYAEALIAIVAGREAGADLKDVYDHASDVGKLYALCGLYFTDREFFAAELKGYRDKTNMIETIVADVVGPMQICDIVFCPYKDTPRIKRVVLDEGETISVWIDKWIRTGKLDGFRLDISGGGYPSVFVDGRPHE